MIGSSTLEPPRRTRSTTHGARPIRRRPSSRRGCCAPRAMGTAPRAAAGARRSRTRCRARRRRSSSGRRAAPGDRRSRSLVQALHEQPAPDAAAELAAHGRRRAPHAVRGCAPHGSAARSPQTAKTRRPTAAKPSAMAVVGIAGRRSMTRSSVGESGDECRRPRRPRRGRRAPSGWRDAGRRGSSGRSRQGHRGAPDRHGPGVRNDRGHVVFFFSVGAEARRHRRVVVGGHDGFDCSVRALSRDRGTAESERSNG